MPENPIIFRQRRDERYWSAQIKDQDKAELEPYLRWISANEGNRTGSDALSSEDPGKHFLTLYISAEDEADLTLTNELIRSCQAPYIILCLGDIRFSPDAFLMFAEAAGREQKPDFIYSDEDRIDENDVRSCPFFKPGWSPDTLMSFLYTGRVGVFRTELLQETGGLREKYGAAAYYDLVLRFTEKAKRICHIPKVLYHIPISEMSREFCGASSEAEDLVRTLIRVKEDALMRRGLAGTVTWNDRAGAAEVSYFVQGSPLVSIIIPSKDHYGMLSACLQSIREHTGYSGYELIIVDNGSSAGQRKMIEELTDKYRARYLYHPMPFNFSSMCNLGAKTAEGDYLLFLNDDIEVVHDDWLEKLLGQAQLPHTGAVGAKLLYPGNGLIQHAGIVDLAGSPVHALMGLNDEPDYYFHRNTVTYNFSAVTGACLMVSAKKYKDAGGMDEGLSVAYNDVALCFRLMELGYWNCMRNDVVLLHHESASRGLDRLSGERQQRLKKERALLYDLYPKKKETDPFYSRNLTLADNDYSLNMLFPTRPCAKLTRPLKVSARQVPYSIERIEKIADTWDMIGWVSAGGWKEYLVSRYMILECADGSGSCFPLNRLRLNDEKLDRIRNRHGRLFTPYVWFHIMIKEKNLPKTGPCRVVLMLRYPGKKDILIRTEHWLLSED